MAKLTHTDGRSILASVEYAPRCHLAAIGLACVVLRRAVTRHLPRPWAPLHPGPPTSAVDPACRCR